LAQAKAPWSFLPRWKPELGGRIVCAHRVHPHVRVTLVSRVIRFAQRRCQVRPAVRLDRHHNARVIQCTLDPPRSRDPLSSIPGAPTDRPSTSRPASPSPRHSQISLLWLSDHRAPHPSAHAGRGQSQGHVAILYVQQGNHTTLSTNDGRRKHSICQIRRKHAKTRPIHRVSFPIIAPYLGFRYNGSGFAIAQGAVLCA